MVNKKLLSLQKKIMENKKFDDLMKKAEELSKSMGYNSNQSNSDLGLETKIMEKIKKTLDENEWDVVITPMMYNPENFMPMLGVLVNTENGLHKKYTISITDNSPKENFK